jgi:pimeloyl-ACP methyl ester carboxylesterase
MLTETMEMIQKSVELPNRVTLSYVEQGDPSGVPVLLLHGLTDSWRSFERVLPYLPESIHAFTISLRGHGDSGRPEAGYQPHDFAGDVAAFIESLNLGPAVVAGHSMGSITAQRFALDYPEHSRGLVLVGSCPTFRGNSELTALWDGAVAQLKDPIDPGFAREFQESTLAQPIPPAYLDTVVQESLKVPARVWQAALRGLLDIDFSGELGKIKTPTLIIRGDRDGMVSLGEQEALLGMIEGARFVVYPGAGHAAHWEEPARFAADLAGFVKSL